MHSLLRTISMASCIKCRTTIVPEIDDRPY